MRKRNVHTGGPIAGSEKARRYAAAILSVLSGQTTTAEGSAMMGVTLPRYYVLETRALEGLVKALEPYRPMFIEEPVLSASGSVTKPNGWLAQITNSSASRDRCRLHCAAAAR